MGKKNLQGGAVLLARQILDSDIFTKKPSDWLKIWLYILMTVNFKDSRQLERGEGYFIALDIARECKVKVQSVYNFVKWAKEEKQMATRKTTRGFYAKVLHYDIYQDIESYRGDTGNDTSGETEAKQKRNRSDTITEECNNGNNGISNTGQKRFCPPTPFDIEEYMKERIQKGNSFEGSAEFTAKKFFNFYEAKNWMIGKNKMKQWKSAVHTWEKTGAPKTNPNSTPNRLTR